MKKGKRNASRVAPLARAQSHATVAVLWRDGVSRAQAPQDACEGGKNDWSAELVNPAGHELQLAAPFDLKDQIAVGLEAIHQHAQAVDAPHREAVQRVNDVADRERHL